MRSGNSTANGSSASSKYKGAFQTHMLSVDPHHSIDSHTVSHNFAPLFVGADGEGDHGGDPEGGVPAFTASGISDGSSGAGHSNHSNRTSGAAWLSRTSGRTARLWAVGGQHWLRTKRMEVENNWSATHKRGIFAMKSSSIADVVAGRWLAHRQQAIATPPILDGRHSACVERRPENLGVCEFDGKLSLARLRSRFVIYTRANLKVHGGGRYVQAATSFSDDPTAGFGPFAPLRIDGYDPRGPGNIYLAAVKAYPFDPSLLLGLFAVCRGDERRAPTPAPGVDAYNQSADGNTDGRSFTGLALSCNGIDWSSLIEIAPTHAPTLYSPILPRTRTRSPEPEPEPEL